MNLSPLPNYSLFLFFIWGSLLFGVEFTPQEKEYIQRHPKVVFGADNNWPPYEFVDERGHYQGLAADILKLVSEKTGIEFEVKPDIWAKTLHKMRLGELDGLTCAVATQKRRQYLLFSEPYLSMPLAIITTKKRNDIHVWEDLEDKTVALNKGSYLHEWMKSNHPNIRLYLADSNENALKALSFQKADAYIGNIAVTTFFIKQDYLSNLKIVNQLESLDTKVSMAVAKDNPLLLSIINKALAAISHEEKKKIQDKWIPVVKEADYTLFYQAAFVVFVILVVTLFWNRKLAQEIARREKVEADLKKAKEEAESASRAKSEFLANMSHEIRTPMNAVLGFTELLEKEVEDAKLRTYIETIHNAGNALLTLINDILDLSKIEAGKLNIQKVPTNLLALIEEVSSVFEAEVKKKGLDLHVEISEGVPESLLLDEGRIRQILFNLIGNSVKFTKEGHIKLYIKAFNIQEHLCKVDLEFGVQDTGIGIPQGQLEKIFEEFEQKEGQSSREFGGTGLGLSISKRLSEMMGGDISVESKEGVGSLFVVHLYNVDIASVRETKNNSQNMDETIVFHKAKLLVADDIEDNRNLIVESFAHSEIEVYTAQDGLEVLKMYEEVHPDIVLMDIRMPKMDGRKAAELIKKDNPKAVIIALSASAMDTDIEAFASKDFDGYLRKPVLQQQLFEMLKSFLPHSVSYTSSKTSREGAADFSLQMQKYPQGLLQSLQKDIQPLLQRACDTHSIDDTKKMAQSLLSLGSEYGVEEIILFAKELQSALELFELQKVQTLLKNFAKLYEIFQSPSGSL